MLAFPLLLLYDFILHASLAFGRNDFVFRHARKSYKIENYFNVQTVFFVIFKIVYQVKS